MDIDLNKECGELPVEDMWQKFCSTVNQAIDFFVPLGPSKNNTNPCDLLGNEIKNVD